MFSCELQAIAGVQNALYRINTPVCVAPNSPQQKIALALSATG
jgi:hypothetical protein